MLQYKGGNMSTIYESGEYLANNRTWHAEDSEWKADKIADIIWDYGVPKARICDLGCGVGEVTREIGRLFPQSEVTGFEIAAHAYAIAKPKETERLKFVLGDPFSGGNRYDVALAIDVFEHVEDFFWFLRSMKDISEYKVFHIPLDMSALAVAMNNPMWARRSVGHLHYFSEDTALAALRECGYEIVATRFTNSDALILRTLFDGGIIRKLAKLSMLAIPRMLISIFSSSLSARLLGGKSLLVVAK
jgi:SAM-dependent methyltransferase